VFTARYALSPYTQQTGFVFKGIIRPVVAGLFHAEGRTGSRTDGRTDGHDEANSRSSQSFERA
jgi:hypothetical protein